MTCAEDVKLFGLGFLNFLGITLMCSYCEVGKVALLITPT